MNTEKNSYIFIFSSILISIIAIVLSYVYISVKPMQDRNMRLEKMQSILFTIGFDKDKSSKNYLTRDLSEKFFNEYIVELSLNDKGLLVDSLDPLDIDIKSELKKDKKDRILPLYKAEKEGKIFYIIPLFGNGLWGNIWGYVSVKEDINTIYKIVFDHEKETPGLGAEITEDYFKDKFSNKMIFDDNRDLMFKLVKLGASDNTPNNYKVDAISGATVTSVGVSDMIREGFSTSNYILYFENLKNNIQ